MQHPLEFSLPVLQEKGKARFEGTVKPEAFEEPLSDIAKLIGPVHVDVEASYRDGEVFLEGRATGNWELECARCVALTRKGYSVKIDAAIDEPGPVIDGLEEVRQSLLLAVPTQPYCREDCKGLCPQCGANRNEKDCGHQVTMPSRFKIIKRGNKNA